jgi:hypothetical protein
MPVPVADPCTADAAWPAGLHDAVEWFASVPTAARLWEPQGAFDRCAEVSAAFVWTALPRYGMTGELVQLAGPPEYPRAVPVWNTWPPEERGHVVVRVQDWYVDWTIRQFDSEAPVPLVTQDHGWATAWTEDEPCPHPLTRLNRVGRVVCGLCRADLDPEAARLITGGAA